RRKSLSFRATIKWEITALAIEPIANRNSLRSDRKPKRGTVLRWIGQLRVVQHRYAAPQYASGPVCVEAACLVDPLERMRPEKIALRLDQIRRQALRAIAVEIRNRRGECRHRHARRHRRDDHLAQRRLVVRRD